MEDAQTIILPLGAAVGDDLGVRRVFELFVAAAGSRWAELEIRSRRWNFELVVNGGARSEPSLTINLEINRDATATLTIDKDNPPTSESTKILASCIDRELHRLRLIAESELLRGALGATSSAVLLFGPSGNILFANDAADRLISKQTEDELTVNWNSEGAQPLFRILCSQVGQLQEDFGQHRWCGRLEISDGTELTSELVVLPTHAEGLERVVMAVLSEVGRPQDRHVDEFADLHQLSPREREVLRLLVLGLDTAGLAERLGISPHTIRDHLKNVFRKTSIRSRSELLSALTGAANHVR